MNNLRNKQAMRLIFFFFFFVENVQNLMQIPKVQPNCSLLFLVFYIIAVELVAVNSHYYENITSSQ